MIGTVAWFRDDAGFGYGFIERAGAPDVYLNLKTCVACGMRVPMKGDRVEFEIATTSRGMVRAVSVRLLEE